MSTIGTNYYDLLGAGLTSAPGAPRPRPATGAPAQPATPSYLSGSPWEQNVTAANQGRPVSFTSPGAPNTNYVTQDAAQQLASLMGARVVQQNMTGMASPGSPAPSVPMRGLDFGVGDVQDPGMGIFQQQRGDPQWLINQRYQAGIAPPPLNTPNGGGPGVPQAWQWNGVTPRTATSATGVGVGAQQARAAMPAPQVSSGGDGMQAAWNRSQDRGGQGAGSEGLIQLLMMLLGGGAA